MTMEEDRQHLDKDDFRRERIWLAPSAFALSDGDDPPISDLVSEEVWDNLLHLPDDVAIRTTNWIGSKVGLLHEVSMQWLRATPVDPDGAPYAPEPAFLAAEEFEALEFAALHGYYRQALGCLRNALETMTHAAALAATSRKDDFAAWRNGDLELRFGESRRAIGASWIGMQIEGNLDGAWLFGDLKAGGWLAILYRRLCAYAHSQVGFNNADFWQSNGPVYRPNTYVLVIDELRETIAVSYVLLRVCWPTFNLPADLSLLLDEPALNDWPAIARRALAAAFT
jgi:hypothetical protein